MGDHNSNDIDRLTQMSIDELYAIVGQLTSPSHAISPKFEKMVKQGKVWFETHKSELVNKLCPNKKIRLFADKDTGSVDITFLAAALGDLIGGQGAIVLSVLVSRYGLSKLCHEFWGNQD